MARKKKGDSSAVALLDPPDLGSADLQVVAEEPQDPEPDIPIELELDRMADDGAPPVAEKPAVELAAAPPPPIIEYREDPAWLKIHKLSDIADDNHAKFSVLDRQTKAAKKAWEASVEDLQEAIRKHKKKMPLFDGLEGDGSSEPSSLAAAPPPVAVLEAPAKEAWREVPVLDLVEQFGLPKRTADALIDSGLTTVGKVADYTAKGKLLIDIKGISEAGSENIFDCMSQFWTAHLVETNDPAGEGFEPEEADGSAEDDESEE